MATPTSRNTFKEYCLRTLGKPVVDINVDNEQVEDRIDDAIQYYRDYHFDGTERIIKKFEITETIKENGELDLTNESPQIIGVTRLFDIGDAIQSSNLFNIRYQIHLNDLFDFTSTTYLPYVTAMRHVEQLEEIFVGKQPIRKEGRSMKVMLISKAFFRPTMSPTIPSNTPPRGLIKNAAPNTAIDFRNIAFSLLGKKIAPIISANPPNKAKSNV